MVKKAQSSVDSLIKGIDFLVLKKHKLDRRTRIFFFDFDEKSLSNLE